MNVIDNTAEFNAGCYSELLLGCGHLRKKRLKQPEQGDEWQNLVTLDVNPACNPDVVHDLNVTPWPFQDEEFDEVHAYEVLEHIGRQGDYKSFFDHFNELYRILKPGGLQVVQGGWVECERVPTGFLCIQRNIIEEMAKDAKMWKQHKSPDIPALFYTQVLEDGRYMGEDFSWCDDYCDRYDTHIHVWPDFDFVHGGYKCNWHSFMNEQVDKYEQAKSMKVIGGGK